MVSGYSVCWFTTRESISSTHQELGPDSTTYKILDPEENPNGFMFELSLSAKEDLPIGTAVARHAVYLPNGSSKIANTKTALQRGKLYPDTTNNRLYYVFTTLKEAKYNMEPDVIIDLNRTNRKKLVAKRYGATKIVLKHINYGEREFVTLGGFYVNKPTRWSLPHLISPVDGMRDGDIATGIDDDVDEDFLRL